EGDALHCGSPAAVLAEMSESSRRTNSAVSSCLYGEDGAFAGGEEISREDLGKVFPLIDEFRERTLPEELVHIRTGANDTAQVFAPFEQYLIPAGEEDYVLTIAPLTDGEETRSEEHTSELQSRFDLVCRLLLEKKKNQASVVRIVTENRETT